MSTGNPNYCLPCIAAPQTIPQAPPAPCPGPACEYNVPSDCVTGMTGKCYDIKKTDTLTQVITKIDENCPYTVPNIKRILTIIQSNTELHALFCSIVCTCDCDTTPPPTPVCTAVTNPAVSMALESTPNMLTTATLTWIPSTSVLMTGQVVKYREQGATAWINGPVVQASDTNVQIMGLNWYTTYEFTVDTICGAGDTEVVTPGGVVTGVYNGCPAEVTVETTPGSLTVSFNDVGGPVSHYTIACANLVSNVSQSWTSPNPVSGIVTHTFTGLSAGAASAQNHQITLTMHTANGPITCTYGPFPVPPTTEERPCIDIDAETVTAVISHY